VRALPHWTDPTSIIESAAFSFSLDKWKGQRYRPECFPPDTLVVGEEGLLPIGSVKEGDVVLSGNGQWRKVTSCFRRPYRGVLCEVKAAGLLPISCTPEHPIWCQAPDPDYSGKGAERKFRPPAYLKAADLPVHGLLRVPRIKETIERRAVTLLPGPRSNDPGEIEVDDQFLTVLGFYLAEGCVKADGRTVQFTFGSDEQEYGWPRMQVHVGGASGAILATLWNLDLPIKGDGRSRRYNHVRFDNDYAYFPIREVTSRAYQGDVCNLEVEEDHTYCVPADVHNCWVEKEALAGVVQRAANNNDVSYLSCRGYMSASEMYEAAQRVRLRRDNGQETVIIYLGDHDPSGLDMSNNDIPSRFAIFMDKYGLDRVRVKRIALNWDQIEEHQPPPNPAKETDSRFGAYQDQFGDESWELDALDPKTLLAIIQAAIDEVKDDDLFEEVKDREEDQREILN